MTNPQVNDRHGPGFHALTGPDGTKQIILGDPVASGQPCPQCGAPDSATVYMGQEMMLGGLPDDVQFEIVWCDHDGRISYRLVDGQGNTYDDAEAE